MIDYQAKLKNEIAHFEQVYKDRRGFDVPPTWDAVETRFASLINKSCGVKNLYEYVARHVEGKDSIRLLGLGSGPCGNEIDGVFPLLECKMELVCVDINPTILDTGRRGAKEKGINFEGIVQDINEIFLEKESFDIIVAYAAMHHFIELDHITKEIGKALKNDGIFITVDIPTRNGYLMWEETLEVVNDIFKILPPKFKLDHAHSATPTYVEEITNMDYSLNSFECIRSEDILPNLRKNLTEAAYVPALSIGRRFFDGIFGPNYDLGEPLDRSIFDLIMNLDEYYIQSGLLKPETFFGAYRKK